MLIGSVCCDPTEVKYAMFADNHGEVSEKYTQRYLKCIIGTDVMPWLATDMVIMGISIRL